MTSTASRAPHTPVGAAHGPGPLGRLGTWVLDHRRLVAGTWVLLVVGLGIFAPGVAVLLDAFLVRLVLLPVLLRLTGDAAWWSPAWLRRVLPTISFAHD